MIYIAKKSKDSIYIFISKNLSNAGRRESMNYGLSKRITSFQSKAIIFKARAWFGYIPNAWVTQISVLIIYVEVVNWSVPRPLKVAEKQCFTNKPFGKWERINLWVHYGMLTKIIVLWLTMKRQELISRQPIANLYCHFWAR